MRLKEFSRFNKIALDIAYRIQNNELVEGMKIKGRSQLSSEYNVSSETIRRAISVLKESDVVEVIEKSGVIIKSKQNALKFIRTYDMYIDLNNKQKELHQLLEQKKRVDKEIEEHFFEIIDISSKLKHKDEIPYYHCDIQKHSHLINQSLKHTHFYQHTNATIIAIKRDEEVFISVHKDFIFEYKDIIYFVCKNEDYNKTIQFIKKSTS